ncbi:MAG: hypothetical protein ABEJ61_04985 [Haloferacaceae archaeon]
MEAHERTDRRVSADPCTHCGERPAADVYAIRFCAGGDGSEARTVALPLCDRCRGTILDETEATLAGAAR